MASSVSRTVHEKVGCRPPGAPPKQVLSDAQALWPVSSLTTPSLLSLAASGFGTRSLISFFFFFKQKTAYEISECDWSSDCALPISLQYYWTVGTQHAPGGRCTRFGSSSLEFY